MRVEPELPDHPKYLRLKRRVSDFAMEGLVRIWGHCQQNQRGGLWLGVDAEYVELIAKWDGEAGLLFRSLVEIGFVEQLPEGILIHDWDQMNGKMVSNWSNGTKGGRPGKPNRNPPQTHAKPNPETPPTVGKNGSEKKPTDNPLETHAEPTLHNITVHNSTEGGVGETPHLRYDLAEACVIFLNERTGSRFQSTTGTLHEIAMRLYEVNNDLEAVKKMLARQVQLWASDARMKNFLRPGTLFNSEKFHDYFGQRDQPANGDSSERRGSLERLIEESPANRQSVYHSTKASAQDRADLKAWRAELETLNKNLAAAKAAD